MNAITKQQLPTERNRDAAVDRVVLAKSVWTRVAVMTLKAEPGAAERVAPALAELTASRQALDVLTRQSDHHEERER